MMTAVHPASLIRSRIPCRIRIPDRVQNNIAGQETGREIHRNIIYVCKYYTKKKNTIITIHDNGTPDSQ